MKIILQLISAIALVSTILPATLFLLGKVDLMQTKWFMLLATIVWFAATPFWMGRPTEMEDEIFVP